MPSKEEEILEKQRKIAERLKKKSKPPPPTGPPPQSKQIVIDLTGNDDGKANQSQQLKRPSRPGLKRPSTGKAAFILAAARAKAAADRKDSSTASSSKNSSTALSSTKSLASIPRIVQANTKSLITSSSVTAWTRSTPSSTRPGRPPAMPRRRPSRRRRLPPSPPPMRPPRMRRMSPRTCR